MYMIYGCPQQHHNVDVMLFSRWTRQSQTSNMPTAQGDISFYQCSRQVIEERFYQCVSNAVVFLDDSSAEVIHWHGGASALFDYGAVDVRDFSSFEVHYVMMHNCCIIC